MGSSEPDENGSPGKPKAHLHAAGKRQDGTWKLQFKKVEDAEDNEKRQKIEFGNRSGGASHDG